MTTIKITVKGLVQGIGYRPFVAELAERCSLGGWVRNTDGIVTILVSGEAAQVQHFLRELQLHSSKGAQVEELVVEELSREEPSGQELSSFVIKESERTVGDIPSLVIKESDQTTEENRSRQLAGEELAAGKQIAEEREKKRDVPMIPVDLPTCDTCLQEMRDPENRRYRHPFISCTSCGPRYSIIEKLPYDRESISMRIFPMCETCDTEYRQQGNRRRHAQTIACPDCGPRLKYVEMHQNVCAQDSSARGENALTQAIRCLKSGGIVAVKDIGGYHLACTPFSKKAVQQLRILKGRERKPFAVMFPDVETVRAYCEVSEAEEALLCSAPRPIVLLRKKQGNFATEAACRGIKKGNSVIEAACSENLAENVCGSSPDIGALLPCNPLQTLLLDEIGPLIMTSANASGELLILDNEKMENWMRQRKEDCSETLEDNFTEEASVRLQLGILSHDRPILTPLDDSIMRVVCGRTQTIRRARGFVPSPVKIDTQKRTFAAGGDLKACFCYVENGKAYLSQYLGDLEDEGCLLAYEKEKARMKKLFGFAPEHFAVDMHPGYASVQLQEQELAEQSFAERQNADSREVSGAFEKICVIQHHEAHVASVIAEHGLKGSVLGFAFDGTGYGRDKTIWGSETFFWDGKEMARIAHLKPVQLIGGDEGAKNADTILYGYLASFGKSMQERVASNAHLFPSYNAQRFSFVKKAIACNINTVKSSSMGRLFDAVSAFLDICHYNGYEGEAAILLENLAATAEKGYRLSLKLCVGEAKEASLKSDAEAPKESFPKLCADVPNVGALQEKWCDSTRYYGDTEALFSGMLDALEQGVPTAEIARGFIEAVSDYICEVCVKSAVRLGVQQIALSGGTFQNRILLERTIIQLEETGYKVYINEQVPPGDGGICLGQAYLCDIFEKGGK